MKGKETKTSTTKKTASKGIGITDRSKAKETIPEVQNIKEGDVFTYNKLCQVLNIPYLKGSGNQKKAQLADLSRYITYEKDKNKYVILEVLDKPLPKGYCANSIYSGLIEIILLNKLSKSEGNVAYITSGQLWYELGMINETFMKYKGDYRKSLLSTNPELNNFDINNFFNRCSSKFTSIINDSLKNLQNRSLIMYSRIHRIAHKTEVNKNGDYVIEMEDATNDQEEIILKVQREVMDELGIYDLKYISFHPKANEFYKKTNQLLKQRYNWDGAYYFYKIIYNQNNVIQELSSDMLQNKRKEMNDKVVAFLNTNAKNTCLKYDPKEDGDLIQKALCEQYSINGGINNNRKLLLKKSLYNDNYVNKQEWLTNRLVKINK